MSRIERRCVGGAAAFWLAAVWVSVGPVAALGCVLAACAGFVFVVGLDQIGSPRRRVRAAKARARRSSADQGSQRSYRRSRPDVEQNSEPIAATLVDAATYGW